MADSEPSKPTKRRLKAPSQTMREQAEQAQASADKPQKNRRLRTAANSTRRPLGSVAKLFDRQPFRFIGLVLVPRFIRNAINELRLVTWPNRRETTRLTIAVLIFAIIFGAAVTAVDYGLDKLFKALIID